MCVDALCITINCGNSMLSKAIAPNIFVQMQRPPSTSMQTPVTMLASSEQR